MRKIIISLVAMLCILCPCFAGISTDDSDINNSEISKITFTNEMISINGLEISPLSWFEIEIQDCLLVRSSSDGRLYAELYSGIHPITLSYEDEYFNLFVFESEIELPAGEYDFSLPAFAVGMQDELFLTAK